jgi:hypothetical protein
VARVGKQRDTDIDPRIVLGLLESVEQDGTRSQRRLAADLGIALGLVNMYIRKCVNKGLLKASSAPARRYVYYLTPQGFSEKSRLTLEYLSISFGFFRQARADCATVFQVAEASGWKRVVLAGISELAEIATISALHSTVEILAMVDRRECPPPFAGAQVLKSFAEVDRSADGAIVTDLQKTRETYDAAAEWFGVGHVLVPSLLEKRLGAAEVEPNA